MADQGNRERDAETLAKLKELGMKLFSEDITEARLAARNLSWMQDDGLLILKQALFGDYSRTTKKSAAYGLRSMQGRMKKLGIEVLEQGLRHRNVQTKAACKKSMMLIRAKALEKKRNAAKSAPKPAEKPAKKETPADIVEKALKNKNADE
jgi:hypothetical protein